MALNLNWVDDAGCTLLTHTKLTMHSLLVNVILFDNDGTLIDSTPGVYYAWRIFGNEYGFDAVKAAESGFM